MLPVHTFWLNQVSKVCGGANQSINQSILSALFTRQRVGVGVNNGPPPLYFSFDIGTLLASRVDDPSRTYFASLSLKFTITTKFLFSSCQSQNSYLCQSDSSYPPHPISPSPAEVATAHSLQTAIVGKLHILHQRHQFPENSCPTHTLRPNCNSYSPCRRAMVSQAVVLWIPKQYIRSSN